MNTDNKIFIWIALVQIHPIKGNKLYQLIDINDVIDETNGEVTLQSYVGAWANVIIKAPSIREGISIIELGLSEKKLEIDFIDKIENVESLIENDELLEEFKNDVKWLLESTFKFKICGRIFPF